MKHSMIILLGGAMASMIAIPQVLAFFGHDKRADDGALQERDEIRQTYKLTPGARVEVSAIRGEVEIQTGDIEVAEVHIVRSAQNRGDLEQFKINVGNSPQGLTIRGEQTRRDSGSGYGPDVHHHVMLRLPRRINLSIRGIGGEVKVGDVDGQLVVSTVTGLLSIAAVNGQLQVTGAGHGITIDHAGRGCVIKTVVGGVRIRQVDGSLDVTGVGGDLSVGISKLGQRGLQINTVTGQVELRFTEELNAQLSTDIIIGELSINLPNVTVQSRPGPTSIRAQIGKGGPPISIKSISKNVRLVRAS